MGSIRQNAFEPLIGHGIFTADGRNWEHARKIIKSSFTHSDIKNLSIFEDHVQALLDRLPKDSTTPIDMARLFSDFTIEMAADFLFGGSESSSFSTTAQVTPAEFAAAFDRGQKAVARNFALGPLAKFLPDPQFKSDCATVQTFVQPYVEKALRSRMSPAQQQRNFLTCMAKQTPDRALLTGALLNTLLEGRDTTAALLSNIVFVLARSPRIQAKLRAQLGAAHLAGRPPSLADLATLPYLQACIRESLRLHAPIPRNSRTALRDTLLPRGGGVDGEAPIFVPAGTQVGYNVFCMQRLAGIWGEDAGEFVPERWAGGQLLGQVQRKWAFLPFNGGPRICLGQKFAMAEVGYVLVRLLQETSGIEAAREEEWVEGLGLTCSTKNGTVVRISRGGEDAARRKARSDKKPSGEDDEDE